MLPILGMDSFAILLLMDRVEELGMLFILSLRQVSCGSSIIRLNPLLAGSSRAEAEEGRGILGLHQFNSIQAKGYFGTPVKFFHENF